MPAVAPIECCYSIGDIWGAVRSLLVFATGSCRAIRHATKKGGVRPQDESPPSRVLAISFFFVVLQQRFEFRDSDVNVPQRVLAVAVEIMRGLLELMVGVSQLND